MFNEILINIFTNFVPNKLIIVNIRDPPWVTKKIKKLLKDKSKLCKHNLRNSDAKYVGNKMPRQFQNFSVFLGNTSAKKMPKTQQKPLWYSLGV